MLNRLYPTLSSITNKFNNVVGVKYETFFPYSIFDMASLYERDEDHINNNVMCVHWFNGHILSKKYVNFNGMDQKCSMTTLLEKEKCLPLELPSQ